MSEMIERVARAICRSDADWEGNSWKQHVNEARAAIEAMREPTVEMQRVVSANWGRRTWSEYNDVIDAALKEKP